MHFFTQPFSTIYTLFQYDNISEKLKDDCIFVSDKGSFYGKPLPQKLEIKIREFIESNVKTKVKMDASKLIIRVSNNLDGMAGVIGSTHLGDGVKGLLRFTPEFANEMEKEFTGLHKFAIAHEIWHLEFDDTYKGKLEKQRLSLLASLGAYSFTVLTLTYNSFGPITTCLLGCVAGKCVELYASRQIQIQRELRADIHAAKQSPEIALGGIDCAKKLQQHNLTVKERWLEGNPSILNTLKKIALDIFLTPEGDIRFVTEHPPGGMRIEKITPFLKKV